MDGPEQERLFETSAGTIAPPEEGLYLGTSGWSYTDREGTVYPVGTPPAGRLAEYVKRLPEGFLFAAKFSQEFRTSPTLL